MSSRGIKGSMGLPGGITIPQWAIDLINFRNDRYWKDLQGTNNCCDFSIDDAYNNVDSALSEMVSFIIKRPG